MALVSDIETTRLSGQTHIDALLGRSPGWNWLAPQRNVINYTFSVASGKETGNTSISGGVSAFDFRQQFVCEEQLAYISTFSGITFKNVSDGSRADLHFANTNLISSTLTSGLCSSGFGYLFDANNTVLDYTPSAYVYLDNVEWKSENSFMFSGSVGYETLLHELGHALGLKHPFEDTPTLPADQDTTANTIMSYTRSGGPYATFNTYDIAALMWLYGGDGLGGKLGSSSGNDFMVGSAAGNAITGSSGNDMLLGLGGNDTLNGGVGTDTALFSNPRADYVLTPSGSGYTVKASRGTDGTDTVSGIERLQFSDSSLAIDMAMGAAGGKAALLIGAVLGTSSLTNKSLISNLLGYFDTGATLKDAATVLVTTGIMDSLAGGQATDAYVNLIYKAVVGQVASPATTAQLSSLIDSGVYTKATFLATVAELPENQTHVDLIGLQLTGIAFS